MGNVITTDGHQPDFTVAKDGTVALPAYTRHIDIVAGAATLGPNAPDSVTTGNARGLGFNNNNEQVYFNWEVPDDWDGASNFDIEIIWSPTGGDAILLNETVKWNMAWYAVEPTQAIDNGTEATGTVTYTETGNPGTDKEMIESEIEIPYTGGNQPLVKGDSVFMCFIRDNDNDNYSSNAICYRWEIKYTATGLAYQ